MHLVSCEIWKGGYLPRFWEIGHLLRKFEFKTDEFITGITDIWNKRLWKSYFSWTWLYFWTKQLLSMKKGVLEGAGISLGRSCRSFNRHAFYLVPCEIWRDVICLGFEKEGNYLRKKNGIQNRTLFLNPLFSKSINEFSPFDPKDLAYAEKYALLRLWLNWMSKWGGYMDKTCCNEFRVWDRGMKMGTVVPKVLEVVDKERSELHQARDFTTD